MVKIEETFERILHGDLKSLSILNTTGVKAKDFKINVKNYIITQPDKICTYLELCKGLESQIAIINLILKVFNKEEMIVNRILESELPYTAKNSKNKILDFLLKFNLKHNSSLIAGALVDKVKLPSKEIVGGYIFIGEESFRIQENSEVVVIFFKSIKNLKIVGVELHIEATENRVILIKLKYNQDLNKFKDKITKHFCELQAQDSIVLNIGRKVTFSAGEKNDLREICNQSRLELSDKNETIEDEHNEIQSQVLDI